MFEFKFNNFLHTQVTNIIKFIFNTSIPCVETTETTVEQTTTTIEATKTPAAFAAAYQTSSVNNDSILIEHVLNECKIIEKLVENWTKYFQLIEFESEKK